MKKIINRYLPWFIGIYLNCFAFFNRRKAAVRAFNIFATPRKGDVLTEQKSFLEPAKDIILQANVPIQIYRWPGDGPTVLLLHGWESNTYRWRNLILDLQKERFNVIAIDAPAHGHSKGQLLHIPLYTETVQKVIEHYKPNHIIGHSLGAMAMVYNQYKYKNVGIEKMVSLGAPSKISEFMNQYRNMLGLSERIMSGLDSFFVQNFGFRYKDFSNAEFAKEITTKGLLIHDELDTIVPIWCSEQVHTQWKNSIFIRTSGLGHSLHQDKVRSQIIAFLQS